MIRRVVDREDAFLHALADLDPRFRKCRSTQHTWDVTQPFRVVDTDKEHGRYRRGNHRTYAERILTCSRCGMRRSDAYWMTSRKGRTSLRRLGATYALPEGYTINGLGPTQDLRDLVLGLQFDQDIAASVPVEDDASGTA